MKVNFIIRKYQEKDILKVIGILEYLYSLGIYKFYLEDLTFGVNIKQRKKKNSPYGLNYEQIPGEINSFVVNVVRHVLNNCF